MKVAFDALLIAGFVATLLWPSAKAAADGVAVSGVNGKAALLGGVSKDTGAGLAEGSLSAPLGDSFGVQLDGAIGKREPRTAGGGGAHVFWRDPQSALVGLTAERVWIGGRFFDRFGAESEYYRPGWMLAGSAGYQDGFPPHSVYTKLDLGIYVTEDLLVSSGFHQSGGRYFAVGGIEWQPILVPNARGIALFADGGVGTHDNEFIVAGIRWYFGADKSLERRHREDDPPNTVGSDLFENAGFINNSTFNSNGNSGSGGGGSGGGPCHGPSCGVGGPG